MELRTLPRHSRRDQRLGTIRNILLSNSAAGLPAASALDSEAEAAIQEQLANLTAGKTVIAIAHRLSTISAMDRLIVLDQGRIIEEGSHPELLRKAGLYAELWSRQSGGFSIAEDDLARRTLETG